ncbi:MAG: hemerythrin domain-containing protein [Bacteriovoracia bacterium]
MLKPLIIFVILTLFFAAVGDRAWMGLFLILAVATAIVGMVGSSRRPESEKSVETLLKRDHQQFKELLARVDATAHRDQHLRRNFFNWLAEDVRRHTHAEEKTVYARLYANPETLKIAAESAEDHRTISDLLDKLDQLPLQDQEWLPIFRVFKARLLQHIRHEERQLFRQMRDVLSMKERIALAVDFRDAKADFEMKKLAVA